MTNHKILTVYCRSELKPKIYSKPTRTQPGQNLSIHELLVKHTRGANVGVANNGNPLSFGEGVSIPAYLEDITELEERFEELKRQKELLREQIYRELEPKERERMAEKSKQDARQMDLEEMIKEAKEAKKQSQGT